MDKKCAEFPSNELFARARFCGQIKCQGCSMIHRQGLSFASLQHPDTSKIFSSLILTCEQALYKRTLFAFREEMVLYEQD